LLDAAEVSSLYNIVAAAPRLRLFAALATAWTPSPVPGASPASE
jgi:hypothetical protein